MTVVCLGSAFFLSKGTQFLMPGPLASAHGAIENCSACHTKSGSGKLSWIHGLVAGDPLADSKACLTCHRMPDTAFNAHSASAEVLKQSTERLTKIAAETPAPQSARAQSIAFPTHDVVARGLYCATCHQEHQGVNFNLNKLSNEQCRSCHVVKFDSFDGHHPKFENYPFKQRTRIIYDHAGHFGKHYPEVAKKDPARRIPATCSTCHNSREDKRVMAVAPFEQTCTACHLDQIIGKERVSGPKGIAF
ncbi:MAG TPA: cytochrome c3 family protein, partial [Hyphomicrobiaceae bacterium]|nr:cytochrome c3 family protein [Hyphomicrobiaceae bacterium]